MDISKISYLWANIIPAAAARVVKRIRYPTWVLACYCEGPLLQDPPYDLIFHFKLIPTSHMGQLGSGTRTVVGPYRVSISG